jgi:hypothetical protein
MTFFWHNKDISLVLTGQEEKELVRSFAKNKMDRAKAWIEYTTFPKENKSYERKIFKYFEDYYKKDPENFISRFVQRDVLQEEAQLLFPCMLEAFGRQHKLATNGLWGIDKHSDLPSEVYDTLDHLDKKGVYHLSILRRTQWPLNIFKAGGHISFPKNSITRLYGQVDKFFIETNSMKINFQEDVISIVVKEIPVKKLEKRRNE